jgi:hypothetical protein
MISDSDHWTSEDDEAMQRWMTQYINYLQTVHVKPEKCSINNHGSYYDLQYLSILRYLKRCALLTTPRHGLDPDYSWILLRCIYTAVNG